MENTHTYDPLLELMERPAFLVADGIIQQVNQAAKQRLIVTGEPITKYLDQDLAAYEQFRTGCLYLNLSIEKFPCGASVMDMENAHLFLLDEQSDPSLKALALAAQQLRLPMNSVFLAAETITDRKTAGQISQSLSQMHRIICNMADAVRYYDKNAFRGETTDLTSFFAETVEKAIHLLSSSGVQLHYTALPQSAVSFVDRQMLERAILNLISNAVKFSPKGSCVDIKLSSKGHMLYFTVHDAGEGIDPQVQKQIFTRYQREPGIEDSRHGLGLGLSVVRSAATNHGGTVLIDHPQSGGTRITMTMDLRPKEENTLHSPISIPTVDYAGGRDHALVELSDVLPYDAY